ncbi:MAG: NAD-dependent epimerase/dehydratase family protein [Myxococcota bacterium]|nr:NAD-dependent epimerase/dehydratase family protein [Myxococcota bacterium]
MKMDRRKFLVGSLAAAACGSSKRDTPAAVPAASAKPDDKTSKKSILVLGGTGFLGPHVVEYAKSRGHTVTLFNRGKTRPTLFPDVEKLQGDRDGKLDALKGRTWDAVVDTSGYVPRIVKMSAELLAPSVKQYIFISTISVYDDSEDRVGADEIAKLAVAPDPTSEEVPRYYGALKALCEQAAEAAMPGRVASIRPGLIVGPGDLTGRFTHWVTRTADGGEVLAPGDGSTPTQWIDGRDLGAWIVRMIESSSTGIYNALGPDRRVTIKEVLDTCNANGGNKATLTWVPWDFLKKHDVAPWAEMPMWIPLEEMKRFGSLSNARALKAGLTFRPLAETAKDTLVWVDTVPEDKREKARSGGIAKDKEAKVLAEWKARK